MNLPLPEAPVFLAAGATCRVYRVGQRVLRMGEGRFRVDAELRRALERLGVPVARPLAQGEGWSLDTLLSGAPVTQLSRAQARQVGTAVAALHRLPVTGYGLLRDQTGPFVGAADTLEAGMRTRLTSAWPFDTELGAQPLLRFAPELRALVGPLAGPLRALSAVPPVINHSDLHGEQLLFTGEEFSGLLDFGDAVAGPPGWDAASFAYFWGWKQLPAFLEGYGEPQLLAQARLLAVPLAFHRAARAANDPIKLKRAAHYLRTALLC
ncbi:phosphotransferase [Deinococcus irradiatisoli]|uniref:phosphotransferase n=1 Tax=Deinococcus irradiatisoli TaxID=2202254 RepID=UPI0011B26CFA|nr:phosphotransferase [Deinococcus irradiatisoli]